MASNLRLLGYNIETMAKNNGVNISAIANACNLSTNDVQRVFEGRLVLTPAQVKAIANIFSCSIDQLLVKPSSFESYGECMGKFNNSENEEIILNIIDDYIDLRESINN
ncbi:MAG: hypothetical protein E7570_06150 [Ruminococcaceae bacterium]|nr:hypothetical protein [Oscillospiraceae bacterium]